MWNVKFKVCSYQHVKETIFGETNGIELSLHLGKITYIFDFFFHSFFNLNFLCLRLGLLIFDLFFFFFAFNPVEYETESLRKENHFSILYQAVMSGLF